MTDINDSSWENMSNPDRIKGLIVAFILLIFFMLFVLATSCELDDHVDCEIGDEESCKEVIDNGYTILESREEVQSQMYFMSEKFSNF